MTHINKTLVDLLQNLDLGSSVAESDTLLEIAKIETSAFTDLLYDRVDLIPGTKGSGKSSLFRMCVDFIPKVLLEQRKVVIAHGVESPGDPVFHVFTPQFEKLTENEFVSFWCIYLVSLAHEQFIKEPQFESFLEEAQSEVRNFKSACERARIPEIKAKKSLQSILQWSLNALASWRPKVKGNISGEFELDLLGNKSDTITNQLEEQADMPPKYINEISQSLEAILKKSDLSLWLMVDRLDEIFPRRSEVERRALRGLLRATRYFTPSNIRVKIFLRDDMLEEIVSGGEGFTGLTHITARQADTLRWTQEQIQTLIVKRFFADKNLLEYLDVDREKIDASAQYQTSCFNKIFPPTVHKGSRQSPTIRWICNRCSDGRGVVTPRDVLDLLISAKKKQQDTCMANPDGESEWIIDSSSIQYGFGELSKRKRDTYLKAEFPHLWNNMEKFMGGKTEYSKSAIKKLLGVKWEIITKDLVSVGFLSKSKKDMFSIPFLYRHAMNLTQGSA